MDGLQCVKIKDTVHGDYRAVKKIERYSTFDILASFSLYI